MKRLLCLAALTATVIFAQPPAGAGPGARFGAGLGAPPTDSVKTYLGLTDTQIASLQAVQQQVGDTIRPLHEEIAAKQKTLRDQLTAGSTDAAALGKLLIDIQAIHKRIATTLDGVQAQAVAVLTADQKTKLKALEEAAKLRDEIQQATQLNLLARPEPGAGMGMGAQAPGMGMGMGNGMGMGMGMGMRPRR